MDGLLQSHYQAYDQLEGLLHKLIDMAMNKFGSDKVTVGISVKSPCFADRACGVFSTDCTSIT